MNDLEKLRSLGKMVAHEKKPMCLHALGQPLVNALHTEGHELWKALAVFVLDPKIRAWLEANDPMALRQARRALGEKI